MSVAARTLAVGTRTSTLARWQTAHVIQRLQEAWPLLYCETLDFTTKGDKTLNRPLPEIGGKGLFTAELEAALRAGLIDMAVHSLKDLPVEDAHGLWLGAILERADVRDGLVAREGWTLQSLPQGARVGTSSLRRAAQLRAARSDLNIQSIRGNIDTRVQKVVRGDYEAAVLAAAGLKRLELTSNVTEWLPLDVMLPAPGQGALAVQCRADDLAIIDLLAAIDDDVTRAATSAERTFLSVLGGGCATPVAAYAWFRASDSDSEMRGLVAALDGQTVIRVAGTGSDPHTLAQQLAEQALQQGAAALLQDV